MSKSRTSTRSSTRLQLLPHQIAPVLHIVAKCKDQHGILLYHQMGTGKTRTTSFALMNYINHPWIIVTPPGLKVVWELEFDIIKATPSKQDITYVDYNNIVKYLLSSDTRGKIIVMDEIHNLFRHITQETGVDLLKKLNQSYKVFALSGTPINKITPDFPLLMTIVAGKKFLPYRELDFVKKYFTTNLKKAAIEGWILPFIRKGGVGKFDFYVNTILMLPIFYTAIISMGKVYLGMKDKLWATLETAKGLVEYDNKMKEGKGVFSPYLKKRKAIVEAILPEQLSSMPPFPMFVIAVISFVASVLASIYLAESSGKLKVPNISLIFQQVKPYISHYNFGEDDPNFASKTDVQKNVNYTNSQIVYWLKMSQNRLNVEEMNMLEVNTAVYSKDFDMFAEITSQEMYELQGRAIGNLTIQDILPHKFVEMIKVIGNDQTVIYSNFYKAGGKLFSKFLETNTAIKYDFLKPSHTLNEREQILKAFQARKIQVLILHPILKEGISIMGARQLHILEPMVNASDEAQVIARVIRYQSHNHLPLNERNVTIYRWVCTIKGFLNSIRKTLLTIPQWIEHDLHRFYNSIPPQFESAITPDQNVRKKANEAQDFMNDLGHYAVRSGIDRTTNDQALCKPWGIKGHKKPCEF